MTDRQQLLRDLAAAEREAPPDLEAEARNWTAIERRLIQGPGPPNLPEPGAGTAAILKWIGGLALVGGLVGGGLLLARGDPPTAPVPGDLSLATGPERQVEPPMIDPPVPELAPGTGAAPTTNLSPGTAPDENLSRGTVPAPATNLSPGTVPAPATNLPPGTGPSRPRPSKPARKPTAEPGPIEAAPAEPLDLAAELRLLASIRAALRRGDSEAALAGVAEHKRKFGAAGALVQERSAHEVEALCAAGRTADAGRLADEFLRRYPDSTHRARVAAGCAEK